MASGCAACRSSSHCTNARDCQKRWSTTPTKQLFARSGFLKRGSAR